MIHKIARFTVRIGKTDAATQAITAFVNAIREREPGVPIYESFQERGGRSFTHVMTFRDSSAEDRHRTAPHTAAFVEALYPLCEVEPTFTDVTLVGSSRRE